MHRGLRGRAGAAVGSAPAGRELAPGREAGMVRWGDRVMGRREVAPTGASGEKDCGHKGVGRQGLGRQGPGRHRLLGDDQPLVDQLPGRACRASAKREAR